MTSSAFEKLDRVLSLEEEQGYRDHAVIGGLERLIPFWEKQAYEELGAAWADTVKQVVHLLTGYGELSLQARQQAVKKARALLTQPELEQVPVKAPKPSEPAASPRKATASRMDVDAPVTVLRGIGDAQAERLARLGIRTIRDLLFHFPRRYDDFANLRQINQLNLEEEVTVVGVIRKVESQPSRSGKHVLRITISDGTGTIECTWFNQPYLERMLKPGREVVISGQVGEFMGRLVFTSPEWEPLSRELLHTGRLVPVYPLTEGISMRWLRRLIYTTVQEWAPHVADPMPREVLESADLIDLPSALKKIHFPESQLDLAKARTRLCFDELFLLQLGVLRKRSEWRKEPGRPIQVEPSVIQSFVESLPFTLTSAQERVIHEVLQDMAQPVPMSRLLQGDVGSGKTVVAVAAMLAAVRAGYQAALMAPTSILAQQHAMTIQNLLQAFPDVRCELLEGSLSATEKERIRSALREGQIDIVIGTHALIQEDVDFRQLGLVIVDEQHRFGVLQRMALREKGTGFRPHMLAMSATPIPRTLALTLYGDLDLSVLDEMPPHRQPVLTAVRTSHSRERIYSFIRSQIEKGRQAFIICPLIEESEQVEARAAVEEYERLSREVFPQFRLGLLHGRVGAEEKERIMATFKAGEYDILVSTAVVEVGIDVPNATVILVEGAERFGLAQLHQFRGRVGRGTEKSYCILLTDSDSEEVLERLRVLEEISDGFALAEKDLEFRGPGEFLGVRQHGLPELRIARLSDTGILTLARQEALALYERDPALEHPQHRALAKAVDSFWGSIDLS